MTADIARYFTNMDSNVFALKNLPEEVVAYLFARYSRSTLSLRDDLRNMLESEDIGALIGDGTSDDPGNASELLQERARTFAEKYILGYGHASVAEHGCIHLAVEDVSIIASKLIEDTRLASYTEKSTRYVSFDPSKVTIPSALTNNALIYNEYKHVVNRLLSAYTEWSDIFLVKVKETSPRGPKQSERGYEAASRATTFDILRYLLPAAIHTNIGLTLNARSLELLITKLLSQPLEEGREIGTRLRTEGMHIVPTLLKYANPSTYRSETDSAISSLCIEIQDQLAGRRNGAMPTDGAVLFSSNPNADDCLIASILYGHISVPGTELIGRVKRLDQATKERIIDEYLTRRGPHDAPGRALESISCSIEMTMDYGAYRDIQRHRMATQTLQPLSPNLGFTMPPDMERFGYAERYQDLMSSCHEGYKKLSEAGFTEDAVYLLPLATRIRVLFTWNLREVFHFIELRSARQGHPSYRRIAQDVYQLVSEAHPLIARYIRPDMKSYALTRD